MKIYSWNVNGIRAVVKKGFMEWFQSENADVLCLQETRAFKEQASPLLQEPKGYWSHWHDGSVGGYSGVVSYGRLHAVQQNIQFHQQVELYAKDGRVVVSDFGDWVLLNVYFPNGGPRKDAENTVSEKLKFYEYFLNYINAIRLQGKGVVICGDYNIAHTQYDIARPEENKNSVGFLPVERAWMQRLIDESYIDTFRFFNPDKRDCYTWWSYRSGSRQRNVGWRIDYIFISSDLSHRLVNAGIDNNIFGSDHCPIWVEIDIGNSIN